LYCGEFGARNEIPNAVREAWFRDMISVLEKHDVAWTVWDFKSGGFGMLDVEDLNLVLPKEILFQ
jgi:endoglucanase